MVYFFATGFIGALDQLEGHIKIMRHGLKHSLSELSSNYLKEEHLTPIIRSIDFTLPYAADLNLRAALDRCIQFKGRLESAIQISKTLPVGTRLTPKDIIEEISSLQVSLKRDIRKLKFAFIAPGKDKYFEQERLFGENVAKQFPSAKDDIKDAGNCLAVDLHTAAVCHLMRVINLGIIALCQHLKVKIKDPEYHEWGPIFTALNKKLENPIPRKRGPKKQAYLEFYSGLLGELSALKNVHRNNAFHARIRYSEPEAVGVFMRVKDFMERLSTRVSESPCQTSFHSTNK